MDPTTSERVASFPAKTLQAVIFSPERIAPDAAQNYLMRGTLVHDKAGAALCEQSKFDIKSRPRASVQTCKKENTIEGCPLAEKSALWTCFEGLGRPRLIFLGNKADCRADYDWQTRIFKITVRRQS